MCIVIRDVANGMQVVKYIKTLIYTSATFAKNGYLLICAEIYL